MPLRQIYIFSLNCSKYVHYKQEISLFVSLSKEKKTRTWSLLNFTAGKECLLIARLCFDNLSPLTASQLYRASSRDYFTAALFFSTAHAAPSSVKSGTMGLIHMLTSQPSSLSPQNHWQTQWASVLVISLLGGRQEYTAPRCRGILRLGVEWHKMSLGPNAARGDKSDHTESWAWPGLSR